MSMVELVAAVVEQEEDDDLLVYCMSHGAADIVKKRKYEGYYSSLIGRHVLHCGMKFREFFRVSRDVFHISLNEIKGDITTASCNRWQTPISAEQKVCLSSGVCYHL